MSTPSNSQNTMRAGLYMTLAMVAFVTNDSLMKTVAGSLPLGQLVAIRGAGAAVLIACICKWQGQLGHIGLIFNPTVMWRALIDLLGTFLFIVALKHMPIANLTAVIQSAPLIVTLFAALFLGETVGWRRALAIVGGLGGVLLIVKPSPANFTVYDLIALAIVFAIAFRDIMTRTISSQIPSSIVALANACVVTVGGLGLAAYEGFEPASTLTVSRLLIAAVFLSLGYLLMVMALRTGELSASAPFRYSIVVFALISGIVVFHEFPDAWAIAGIALIVAAGLYAIHREARISRTARMNRRSAQPPTPECLS